jgi:hypothetical protein
MDAVLLSLAILVLGAWVALPLYRSESRHEAPEPPDAD